MNECKDCEYCEATQNDDGDNVWLCWVWPVYAQDVGINNLVGEHQHECGQFEPKVV